MLTVREVRNRVAMRGMVVLAAMAATFAMTACADDSDPMAPQALEEEVVLDAMEAAIQDEYRAELIYEKVIDDFGSVRPFTNIIYAEVRHSEALGRLYAARGLPIPVSRWSWDDVPGFSSLTDACQAGVVAEIENAGIYEEYLDLDLPSDVRVVFESNQRASLQNHLPAFERCS
jgi:hypothetical protein